MYSLINMLSPHASKSKLATTTKQTKTTQTILKVEYQMQKNVNGFIVMIIFFFYCNYFLDSFSILKRQSHNIFRNVENIGKFYR